MKITLNNQENKSIFLGVGMIAKLSRDGIIHPADENSKDVILNMILRDAKAKNHNTSTAISTSTTTSSSSSLSSTATSRTYSEKLMNDNLEKCGEIPRNLMGRVPINLTVIPINKISQENPFIWKGGEFSPDDCKPKDNVAIIVPYRNRSEQLSVFLRHIHPFLSKQELHYRIYIINQVVLHQILWNKFLAHSPIIK